jgi:hypothetical protein
LKFRFLLFQKKEKEKRIIDRFMSQTLPQLHNSYEDSINIDSLNRWSCAQPC